MKPNQYKKVIATIVVAFLLISPMGTVKAQYYTYSFSPSSISFESEGRDNSGAPQYITYTVAEDPEYMDDINVVSDQPWIHIDWVDTESGIISISCESNSGSSRTAQVGHFVDGYFYGQPVTITQDCGMPSPGPISGNQQVCRNTNQSYSISPVAGATSYSWSFTNATVISGQGTTNVTVSFGAGASAKIIVQAYSSACGYSDTRGINITFLDPTPANAGLDQTGSSTCGSTTVALAGNTPSIGTGSWSVLSGAGGSFGNSSSPTSTFSGTAGSTYVLRWTTTNGACTSTDNVNIKFNKNPTTANAGPDQTGSSTCGLTTVALAANAPVTGTGSWSIVSGTGGSFENSSSPTSTFSGTAGTTYVLRWTISNSPCSASTDNVTIKFNKNPAVANAGPDQLGSSSCGSTTVNLAGNTPTAGTGSWSIVSGTGGSFGNSSSPTSTFSGTPGTTYVLKWTISNIPCGSSTDNVTIVFNENPPVAYAGPDQTGSSTCGLTTVTLAGNTATTGIGSWSVMSGAGGSFGNSSSPTSTFSGTAGTTYVLRWAISNSPCASTDDVTIRFNPLSEGGTLSPPAEAYGSASGTLSVTGFTGTIQKWQKKVGEGSWTDIVHTASSLTYTNITTTTSYQVEVKNGVCPAEYSDDAAVTIYPVPSVSIQDASLIAPGGSTTLITQGGLYSYAWFRNDVPISGASSNILEVTKPGEYKVSVKATSTIPTYTTGSVTIGEALPNQLTPVNYIMTTVFQKEGVTATTDLYDLGPGDLLQTLQYFDGLGRLMQSVSVGNSPAGNDMIQPIAYDAFGRETIKYLPYARGSRDGRYVVNAISDQNIFYQTVANAAHDESPFLETKFESSPLNRVLKQGAPGAPWQPDANPYSTTTDHSIKYAYETNLANEVLQWTYTPPTTANILGIVNASTGSTPTHYDASELFKTKRKDEEQHEVIEYKDKQGRVVLKRVQGPAGSWADTYYIYDDRGQLIAVMPPETTVRLAAEYFNQSNSTKENFLKRWAFRYRYDGRRRMIIKQVPGAEPVYTVYDNRDRLVLTQDGNQRAVNKWSYTKYDELNRPVITGIYTHNSMIDQNEMSDMVSTTIFFETYNGNASNHGYTKTVFHHPDFVQSNFEDLTITYYDDYAFKSLLNNTAFDYKNNELEATGAGLKAQDQQAFDKVKSQVTGTKVKVLNTSTWLWTTNYYDDKYRVIQSTSSNYKGGFDRITNVYDFIGKVLRTKTFYSIPGHPDRKIIERFTYDHAGRLVDIWHQVEGTPEVLLTSNEYNELGQLMTKKLHKTGQSAELASVDPDIGKPGVTYSTNITSNSYSSSQHTYIATNSIKLQLGFIVPQGSTFNARIGYSQQDAETHNEAIQEYFLQEIDYRYTIRGWLKTINNPAAPETDDLFTMELHYNTPTANGGNAQYNGNISEAIWKSAGMDKQSYGYDYDPMNRLTKAEYFNIARPQQNGRYNEKIGDVAVNRPGYDLNGNIRNLFRNGKKAEGTFGLMDDLHYDYTNSGNQLVYVSDDISTHTEEEGFKEVGNGEGGTSDYAYDDNGNMTRDDNKGIINIEYNHLNLPSKVSKSASEYITYTYDATGRKLIQQVFGTTPKATEYVGALVFEDDTLQFVLHPEGRIIADNEPGATDPWEYQYFLKDHLGNTRVVFSEKKSTSEHRATMENNTQGTEMATFRNYNSGVRSALPVFDHTDAGTTYTYSQLLNGGSGSQVGLAKSFEVNPGDVFDLEVYAKYEAPGSTPNNVNALLSQLVSAFSLGAGTTPLDGSQAQTAFNDLFSAGPWITSSQWESAPPKAYLNYILFDENFVLVDFGFDQISTAGEQLGATPVIPHDYLSLHVKVEQKGYLYVYLSNEQPTVTNVYFDDMKIVKYTDVHQVEDYYPFGATFNSYTRENSVPQNFLYQEKEWQQDLSLNLYDFEWRQYDPFTNRTTTMDPHVDSYPLLSPYSWVANNPISIIDPDGQDIINSAFATTYTGADAQNMFRQLQAQSTNSQEDPGERTFYSFNSRTQARREQMAKEEKENQPGFWSGMGDGVVAGGKSTVDFFKSLGTSEGWEDLGRGLEAFADLASPIPNYTKIQTSMAATNYVQNIPNMSAYEMGYDLGYGVEKAAEFWLTRRVMPISKASLGLRTIPGASRYTTLQSVATYGKWGKLSTRLSTFPYGAKTLDRATFINRNFVIPFGRIVGAGQLQYFQKN